MYILAHLLLRSPYYNAGDKEKAAPESGNGASTSTRNRDPIALEAKEYTSHVRVLLG